MARFEPDFSIFGILAGDIQPAGQIEDTRIDYANNACTTIYGDLVGVTFYELFKQITGDPKRARQRFDQFIEAGKIAFEGRLNKRFVKFHSRIIDCRDDDACAVTQFIQAGITDITESVLLKKLLYGTSEALRRAAEAADDDTGNHITRINKYAGLLARLAGTKQNFVESISSFAQLHDIGKIKVAEIIRIPRKLTEAEFSEVKKHPQFGGKIVKDLEGLELAYDIIMDHHEKWDGSGYPSGKRAEEISLAGRIVCLVDVFDALVSTRPYKPAYTYEKAFGIIRNGDDRIRPEQFDPRLLRIFLSHYTKFVNIHKRMRDDSRVKMG